MDLSIDEDPEYTPDSDLARFIEAGEKPVILALGAMSFVNLSEDPHRRRCRRGGKTNNGAYFLRLCRSENNMMEKGNIPEFRNLLCFALKIIHVRKPFFAGLKFISL